MRRTTALRQRGANADRWTGHQTRNRHIVERRANWRCEVCRHKGSELHHLFGRRQIVAEPIASHAAFTLYLCHPCHLKLHRPDKEAVLIEHQRWRGIQRALDLWAVPLVGLTNSVDAAREIERVVNPSLREAIDRLEHHVEPPLN